MAITYHQQPLDYTPSNAQHVYNVSSTLVANTDFRFIVDVYVNPRETNVQRISRLLVQPNTSSRGIVDVYDIIKNYLKPNPRSQFRQTYNMDPLPQSLANVSNGILTNTQSDVTVIGAASIPSNSFNTNSAYEYLPHVAEYRVIIGEQYTNSSGTTTTIICEDPATPISTIQFDFDDGIASYTGSPNTVLWTDCAQNPVWAVSTGQGWLYEHTDSSNVFIASGTSSSSSGSYIATLEPSVGDILSVQELATGVVITFEWNVEVGISGWSFINITPSLCTNQGGDFITIWPGTQDNVTNFNYNNIYWSGNTNGVENYKYWEQFKYKFQVFSGITATTPAQFLTTFGDELYSADIKFQAPTTTNTIQRIRRRYHHPECPVVLSYFFRDFNDAQLTNSPLLFGMNYAENQQDQYTYYNIRYVPTTYNYDTSPKNRIVYTVPRVRIYPGGKIALFASNQSGTSNIGFEKRVSEVVEYYFWEADCLSDPIHFLFINRRGVWDTYTFDRKNIKTYNKETNLYAQGSIRDSVSYNPFFYTARDIIYDQDVVEEVEAQTNFMVENDKQIVEELFLSPYVYLIKDNYYFEDPAPAFSKQPYYIPVIITNNSLQEYKQRYNKIFQYTISFRYNPNQLYRSSL